MRLPLRELLLGEGTSDLVRLLQKREAELEDKLETRKAVDRAKGILMDQYGLKEQDAFRRIQVQSMNTRKSMREIAEAIIIANSV